jgi:hypothetical protein
MSEKEMKNRLENLSKNISPMPDEQKSFILGYMEGVCQMSEKQRKEEKEEK